MKCTLLNDTKETYPLPVKGPVLPDNGINTVVPYIIICFLNQCSHTLITIATECTPAKVASSASKMISSRALEK